jgi:hypothetical protein
MDGMYFFLLFIPIVSGIFLGYLLRKKIVYGFFPDHNWSQNLFVFFGVSVQNLIMIIGVLAGLFLIKLI